MPATEQTWRDQKLLHVVFGLTALVLLVSNVWMFGKDHDREWKGYQRKYRDAEQQLTDWKMQEEASLRREEQDRIQSELTDAQLQPPEEQLYAAFKSEVRLDAEQRGADAYDFAGLDEDYTALGEISATAMAARQQVLDAEQASVAARQAVDAASAKLTELASADRDQRKAAEKVLEAAEDEAVSQEKQVAALVDAAADTIDDAVDQRNSFLRQLQRVIDKARGREDDLASRRKFRSADFDAARATLDLHVRDNRTDLFEDQQTVIDEIKVDLDELTLERQAATAHRKNLQQMLAAMTTDEDTIAAQLKENGAELDRLAGAFAERNVSYFDSSFPFLGKKWLELPILDAFNSPLKIDNLWTEQLTIPYGSFGEVRRFDRCTTCHRGIAKTAPGSAVKPAYEPARQIGLVVQMPDAEPADSDDRLNASLGFQVAEHGLLDDQDVTVNYVAPPQCRCKCQSSRRQR